MQLLSIASMLKDFLDFLQNLIYWLISTLEDTARLFQLIPRYVGYLYDAVHLLPTFFLSFGIAYISLKVLFRLIKAD